MVRVRPVQHGGCLYYILGHLPKLPRAESKKPLPDRASNVDA